LLLDQEKVVLIRYIILDFKPGLYRGALLYRNECMLSSQNSFIYCFVFNIAVGGDTEIVGVDSISITEVWRKHSQVTKHTRTDRGRW